VTVGVRPRRSVLRRGLQVTGAVLLAVVLYLAVTTAQVVHAAGEHQQDRVGAIIVMGAAQYDGTPSPDLAARLAHALALWRAGVAPTVVVTGGKEPGDTYSESEVGADWLAARGVPQQSILREVNGRDTWQSLDATAAFLHDRAITRVVLVSDPFHDERITLMASALGLQPEVSPATDSPIRGSAAVPYYAKEIAEVATGRIIGWRRLNDLDEDLGIAGT
jgi:uncharacterized SAM-binding protein YcdF (DUF218 family)